MTRCKAANLAWQLGGNVELVRALAAFADVLALVECRTKANKPLDVAAILGPDWRVVQDLSSPAKAGCALAVRRASGVRVLRHRLVLASPPGPGVQARYLLDAALDDQGDVTRLGIIHRPLGKTGRQDEADEALEAFVRRCRRARRRRRALRRRPLRWAILGDLNGRPSVIARRLGAPHVFGADVMAFIYSTGWGRVRCSAARTYPRRSDHHILTITT